MMKLKKYCFIFLVSLYLMQSFSGFAQERNLWLSINKNNVKSKLLAGKANVISHKTFVLDTDYLKDRLNSISKISQPLSIANFIEFPDQNGILKKYAIKETSLMHPDLATKFPDIKTYSGYDIKNKSSTIHFTLNSLGLYAMILTPDIGTIYIDPYTEDRKKYMVYLKKDIIKNGTFECLTKSETVKKTIQSNKKFANDLKLRTFRLALAATEEYATFHVNAAGVGAGSTRNDSINAVMSAFTITMARVNAVFERDVALTMQLVANNDQLIFLQTDPGEDPYSNSDGSAMLTENQTTIDNIVGTANYDIGHVFSTGGGGVAFLGSPCGPAKAGGVTGNVTPVGDSFDIDYVAHEMGHQFGAHHTFNGNASNCNGNRYNDTAVEPGSGSTIMAYAGICTPQNVQNNSDDYFHAVSIKEMFDNISTGASQCALQTGFIANLNAPTANAGNDFIIPKSTPFVLKGEGFDADGDEITYAWEQIDNEVVGIQIPPTATQTAGTVFRSLPPTKMTDRYMPKLSTVISGFTSSIWEVIPSISRTLNFSLTVRDDAVGEGQTANDTMTITVNDAAGPFTVTSQNVESITWAEGGLETITWNVAGTDSNGINVSHVNILLSLDGGSTFPITLASNTPNDGEKEITVPNTPSPDVRLLIEAVDNIFYAVNSESFSIGSFETTCTTYDSTDIPKTIPDNSSTGVTSVINIVDDFTITDVNVSVDVTHTWLTDLQIYLKAPDGTEVLIYDRSCAPGVQRQNINAIFDDDASSTICNNADPAISGTTQPANLLAAFNGISSFGNWILKVVDNAPVDIGTLNNWSVELCQTNQTVSVEDITFKDFKVFPNPFENSINLFLNVNSDDDVLISIYDVRGRMIINKKFPNPSFIFREELNFDNLAEGIYVLTVQSGSSKASKKIIKY
ncbi:MAG: M12 family metallo-peptidase [Flavobacteriaceae bacterium]|nr:M12 family metallo-peptidase [Flavobacteriaceae bacterium]